MQMTWEEKFAAINAIEEASLIMRKPGDWLVSQHVEIGGDGVLRGDYGNGRSPEEAVERHWDILTQVKPPSYVVTNAMRPNRKHWRWEGFMWKEIPQPAARETAHAH